MGVLGILNVREIKDMKIIVNKFLPPKGFSYINLFGILFTRREEQISETTANHEVIHTAQMKEMLYIPFYLCYIVEWLIRLAVCLDSHKAYRSISFEREAYGNQGNLAYLEQRKRFSWVKYIVKSK